MTASEYNRNIPNPGDYARAWRALNTMDASRKVTVPGWVVGMPGWGNMTRNAGEVLSRVRSAMDARINARAGVTVREHRNHIGLVRDAQRLRDIAERRVRVYQFETRNARERFSHLLARHDD